MQQGEGEAGAAAPHLAGLQVPGLHGTAKGSGPQGLDDLVAARDNVPGADREVLGLLKAGRVAPASQGGQQQQQHSQGKRKDVAQGGGSLCCSCCPRGTTRCRQGPMWHPTGQPRAPSQEASSPS